MKRQHQQHSRQPLIPHGQQQQQRSTIFGNKAWSDDEMLHIEKALHQGLDMEDVAKRRGPGGTTLTYIEGWKAFEMANDIFGVDGWSCQIKSLSLDYPPEYSKSKDRWIVSATAVVTIKLKNGSYHEDVGCGNGISKNKYDAIESAKKQAVTDARKRALRLLGPKLGNCLYDKKFKVMKRKAPHSDDGINTKNNRGNHASSFRPSCNTAPPASYQSRMNQSITPANISFKRRDNKNVNNNNNNNNKKDDKNPQKTVHPLLKKQRIASSSSAIDNNVTTTTATTTTKTAIDSVNNKDNNKTPVTNMKKNTSHSMKINNGKRKDDPFAYDDSIYKSIDLDQLDNKALLATTKRTLHNDTEQAHIEDKKNDKNATDTDPFAYDGTFNYNEVPDPAVFKSTNNCASSVIGSSVAY